MNADRDVEEAKKFAYPNPLQLIAHTTSRPWSALRAPTIPCALDQFDRLGVDPFGLPLTLAQLIQRAEDTVFMLAAGPTIQRRSILLYRLEHAEVLLLFLAGNDDLSLIGEERQAAFYANRAEYRSRWNLNQLIDGRLVTLADDSLYIACGVIATVPSIQGREPVLHLACPSAYQPTVANNAHPSLTDTSTSNQPVPPPTTDASSSPHPARGRSPYEIQSTSVHQHGSPRAHRHTQEAFAGSY
ncbi:hypothetical protein M409DRAFT_28520 [Zasmidium cellare ATCC 36951]|uniref:Uncharacterized protein n=1 Tax=Zasmidium cellare ATCC 36951 TaxID=1080233 RepID=A0A6A6C2B9_ZASCE|nr:uncharacterized protein M409DRAFT_28520 [Zasmidium cellare ATCC 36951]KAF2161191.1 hypothetical protein M409DRAFT_28520 [Zasmidium cellare ATCC 36951]